MDRSIADYSRYALQIANGFRTTHEQAFATTRDQDLRPYLDKRRSLKVLDVANGRLRPQYMLLKAKGHKVFGVDLINRPERSVFEFAYCGARRVFQMQARIPAEVAHADTLACASVDAIPFPSNSFDLVTSVAAFEHFLDVPAVISELHRVLKPHGLVWVCIHLFTSPSGGHNVTFTQIPLRRLPTGVEPWDHLRRRRLPSVVPLNRWRKNQYLDTFAAHFEILNHYCALREGEEFLTPQIEGSLSDYSRDELTCQAYVIIARKRA